MPRIRKYRFSAALPLAAVLLVAGCAEVATMLERDRVAQQRIDYRPGVSEIYCYRTLAGADCYAEPQPGPPNRLINAYPDDTDR